MTDDDTDDLPDFLTDDDIIDRGGDPEELLRAEVEPLTGNNRVRCWARQDVIDWLSGNPGGLGEEPSDLDWPGEDEP